MNPIFETKAIEYSKSRNEWEYLTVDGVQYRADIEPDEDNEDEQGYPIFYYVIFYRTASKKGDPAVGDNLHWHYALTVHYDDGEVVDWDDRSSWTAKDWGDA